MLAGFTLGGVGAVLVAAGGVAGAEPLVVIGGTVLGLCSLAMPAMTATALSAPSSYTGVASGVLNTARQTGGALGALYAAAGSTAAGLVAPLAAAVLAYLAAVLATLRATRASPR
ncbi:MAG TPA: hypothetical protein VGH99_11800 [Pseudonocardia sp.]|jgi:DHA2 family methylenomycin A resistance protein-like MFS transporter